MKLNPSQQRAVDHEQGPLLVLAGAGSGKTRVITHRIARLIERGHRPESIVAVSFTNKSAAEMAHRMVPLVGSKAASLIRMSTFHSFGLRFLEQHSRLLGYGDRFVVFDQGDSTGLLRELLRQHRWGSRKLDVPAIAARISNWKNARIAPDELTAAHTKNTTTGADAGEYDDVAMQVYGPYEQALRAMHAFDFDDLVVVPLRILQEHHDVRQQWRMRVRHLLVDEFQDTNRAQLELVLQLTNELGNLCAVGDDDQSIYGWRGADVRNIVELDTHLPNLTVIKLEDNYRSQRSIVEVANQAIAASTRRKYPKTLRAVRQGGEKVQLWTLPTAEHEAKAVTAQTKRLHEQGRAWSDMAVLYRSNLQARLIEEEFRASGVPYRLFGGTQFFDRKEVRDAVAYLRLVIHPQDELSLRRILNYPPRGVGEAALGVLQKQARGHRISLHQAVEQAHGYADLSEHAKQGLLHLSHALRKARARLQQGERMSPVGQDLLGDVGLMTALQSEQGPQAQRRIENVRYVLGALARFEQKPGVDHKTLAQFLQRLALGSDDEEEERGNQVTLCTLHAAKGLEFRVVFLIGCVEGQLPHSRVTDPKITEVQAGDVDEERRLFYVGITRAQDMLYLTRPKRRMMRGRTQPLTPSRFLEGLPEAFLEHVEPEVQVGLDHDEVATMASSLLAQLRANAQPTTER
jgi:superfamily I DNA/RNA helicase